MKALTKTYPDGHVEHYPEPLWRPWINRVTGEPLTSELGYVMENDYEPETVHMLPEQEIVGEQHTATESEPEPEPEPEPDPRASRIAELEAELSELRG